MILRKALLKSGHAYTCGAVILNNKWILTAAHCVWNLQPSHLVVTVGKKCQENKLTNPP